MAYGILSARDVRVLLPAITPLLSKRRVVVRLRRLWRGYWDRQARRAIAVMAYALDDRSIDRDADRSPG